jgi:hypothetical protein
VDEETYLRSHTLRPTLTIPESSVTVTELQYGYASKDFVNTPQFSSNDDRDGINHLGSVAQSVVFAKTGRLRVGYSYDTELTGSSSTQDDWAYQGHKVSGNLRLPTLEGFRLDFDADYYYQRYRYPNEFSSSTDKRLDRIQTYGTTLSRTFDKWVTLTLQYIYNRNDSNIGVFDYRRHVYSVILAGSF